MANEEDGQPPPGKDDRVKAWLKHQEKEREAQTDSNAITTSSGPGTQLYESIHPAQYSQGRICIDGQAMLHQHPID